MHRVPASMLLDYSPDGEGAEQYPYGSFVETEAVGYLRGSSRKLLEESHLGCGVEGGDHPPVRHLTRRGQKRKAIFVAQLEKS